MHRIVAGIYTLKHHRDTLAAYSGASWAPIPFDRGQ